MKLLENALSNDLMLSFDSYYKYTFYFSTIATLKDGTNVKVTASIGGDSDDIYRLEINANEVKKLNKEDFTYISVVNVDTNETDFYDSNL